MTEGKEMPGSLRCRSRSGIRILYDPGPGFSDPSACYSTPPGLRQKVMKPPGCTRGYSYSTPPGLLPEVQIPLVNLRVLPVFVAKLLNEYLTASGSNE